MADAHFILGEVDIDGDEQTISRDELHEGYTTYSALRSLLKVAPSNADSEDVLSKLTVVQLKERLRAAGLRVSGRKAELIARLCEQSDASTKEVAPVS